ncbi:hypothetical protein [Marinitenerispora sediminis]|nr:hypothetical protein [Marinitenerispora sediminis]
MRVFGHRGVSAEEAAAAQGDGGPGEAPQAVLLGCHGGAGASTMQALLGTPWNLGCYSPELRRIETFGRPLVLVARDSASAGARVIEAVTGVTTAGATIACLVIIADGSGPEPKEATGRLRLIEDRVGAVVRFPFVAGLRYADANEADKVELPKKAVRALTDIHAACAKAMSGSPNELIG